MKHCVVTTNSAIVTALQHSGTILTMNYRHSYHAGSFADVIKHICLITLLRGMQRKDTPFCYLDTHAGIGMFDLMSEEAQKTKEYLTGISQILAQKSELPIIEWYRELVMSENPSGKLQYYPGSPWFAKQTLRPQDRMILAELHHSDVDQLKNVFRHDKQVAVHHQNGYLAMKAFLPPREKRGLVFIDPPFENKTEWDSIVEALTLAYQHWRAGTHVIWYPIKKETYLRPILQTMQSLPISDLIHIEALRFPNDVGGRLNGCGIIALNPPWQIEKELKPLLNYLKANLSCHQISLSHSAN